MVNNTLFSKIINREIQVNIIYQDHLVTVFNDINPQAPIHVLIVPNLEIPTVNDVMEAHEIMLGHLFTVAAKIAFKKGISKNGYRLIVNCNQYAGQEIYHLHMHLLGGKHLGKLLV